MSENRIPLDVSRVKRNALLLSKWTGRPLSACQELTARAMGATSWQNLLTMDSFAPDEGLDRYFGRHDLVKRLKRQAELLAQALDLPLATAAKLVAFWQPTAKKPTAFGLFACYSDFRTLQADAQWPVTWLNRQTPAKQVLKLAAANPSLWADTSDEKVSRPSTAFFTMVRDGIAVHGIAAPHVFLLAERAAKRRDDWNNFGDVAIGPGSIQPNPEGGYMLAKYSNQSHGRLPGLTEKSAWEIAIAFGLDAPDRSFRESGFFGFYSSQAALGLVLWLTHHPRKCAEWAELSNSYMGQWVSLTLLRAEFELVRAGLLV